MNNKGFTTLEVVLSFAIVVIVMVSMSASIVYYRDQTVNEEVETRLIDYRNSMLKMIYDSIVSGDLVSISACEGNTKCANFIDKSNVSHQLTATTYQIGNAQYKKGIYLAYDNVNYFVPDSDLNKYNTANGDQIMIDVFDFEFQSDSVSDLYKVSIPIYHYGLNKYFSFDLIIS